MTALDQELDPGPDQGPEQGPDQGSEQRLAPAQSDRAVLQTVLAIASDLDLTSVLTRITAAAVELTGARYGAFGVLGDDGETTDLVTLGAEHDPTRRTHLEVPVRTRGKLFGTLHLGEKRGGEFSAQDATLVESLTQVAGMAIENARAYGLSEQRRIWLEASADLADALQGPMTLTEALGAVCRQARRTSGAVSAAVVQFPPEHHPVIAAEDSAPGFDIVEVLRDVIGDARTADQQIVALEVRLEASRALVLPLRLRLADPAVLVVVLDGRNELNGYDQQEFLAGFADQAALAVERAEAVRSRQEVAVLTDRARIARDLHDVAIQRLFATGLRVESLRHSANKPVADLDLGGVVKDIDLTIKDIRACIFDLQHQEQGTLRAAVHAVLDEYAEVLGFAPALRTHGSIDTAISPALGEHLLAVLREALSNVVRHARATEAAVEIAVSATDVVLRVVDGGIGIPEHLHESGLRNVRERAELLGGTLAVTPNAGPGTTLTWQAPLA